MHVHCRTQPYSHSQGASGAATNSEAGLDLQIGGSCSVLFYKGPRPIHPVYLLKWKGPLSNVLFQAAKDLYQSLNRCCDHLCHTLHSNSRQLRHGSAKNKCI